MQNNRQNTEMPAQKNDPMLTDSEEQLYTVMVDGEEMQLTLEQLIAAAEQGLSRANQSARTDGMAGGQPGMTDRTGTYTAVSCRRIRTYVRRIFRSRSGSRQTARETCSRRTACLRSHSFVRSWRI